MSNKREVGFKQFGHIAEYKPPQRASNALSDIYLSSRILRP